MRYSLGVNNEYENKIERLARQVARKKHPSQQLILNQTARGLLEKAIEHIENLVFEKQKSPEVKIAELQDMIYSINTDYSLFVGKVGLQRKHDAR